MKKKAVGFMLALSLSFTMTGCGSSAEAEQKQEEGQGAEEETEEESDSEDVETDSFVFFSEAGEREYLLEEFEWEETGVEFTTQYETDVYNMEGRNVGYIKPDVDVTITEHGINSAWYRFKNPESGTGHEYLCVLMEDVTAQGGEIPIPQDENSAIDTEMMWIYPKDYDTGYDKEVSSDLVWEECNVEFHNESGLDLYADDGKNVAWLHEDITVTFTEENEEWYRFENPENRIDSEFLMVTKESLEAQKRSLEEQAEYEEQDKAYDDAMALIDENKTYTVEEFHELMKTVCDIVGTEYSADLIEDHHGTPGERTLNLNGQKLKQMFEDDFLWWLIIGPTGNNSMDVYFLIDPDVDTSGDFQAVMFARFHQ